MLRESRSFVSGQEICDRFQVSRTAVWKAVSQLREEGYPIEAVRNRGYCLKETPEILSAEEVESRLHTEWAGHPSYYFTEVNSTNTRAKELGEKGAVHGTVVMAGCQTAGKGRRGHTWVSPADGNLYITILVRPEFKPDIAPMLTIVMALSVAQAIRDQKAEVGIKWPNDMVLNGKKVCGMLTEMSTDIESIHYVVIGVGINANTRSFPPELDGIASSLSLECGREFSRAQLAVSMLEHFEENYERFKCTGDLSALREEYCSFLVNQGKEVRILEPGNERNGTALGINDKGELLVRNEKGEIEEVYAGEVSVRGLFGYV